MLLAGLKQAKVRMLCSNIWAFSFRPSKRPPQPELYLRRLVRLQREQRILQNRILLPSADRLDIVSLPWTGR